MSFPTSRDFSAVSPSFERSIGRKPSNLDPVIHRKLLAEKAGRQAGRQTKMQADSQTGRKAGRQTVERETRLRRRPEMEVQRSFGDFQCRPTRCSLNSASL